MLSSGLMEPGNPLRGTVVYIELSTAKVAVHATGVAIEMVGSGR